MITSDDIIAARKALKKTQSEVAFDAGVNLSTVWRWEKDGPPRRGTALKFIERMIDDAKGSPAEREPAA